MRELAHTAVEWYFDLLETCGLFGVALLMFLESTILPLPSELIVPPAAYLACGKLGWSTLPWLVVVIAMGTLGTYLGTAVMYGVGRTLGRPLVVKYGKYLCISEALLHRAEDWVRRYGAGGIFLSRLMPAIRQVAPIPAGIIGMPFRIFTLMTLLGSGLWCSILAIFGLVMAPEMDILVRQGVEAEPARLKEAMWTLTWGTLIFVGAVSALYLVIMRRHAHLVRHAPQSVDPTDAGDADPA
jgi:membrane protein DedA with SNARE-associated domain